MSSIRINENSIVFNTTEYPNVTTQMSDFPAIGTILMWGGNDLTKLSAKFLPCDGRNLSKTTYSSLYSIIGNTYGSDATTFNLPNTTKRFAVGSTSNSSLTLNVAGTTTGGSAIITNENFPHTHSGFSLTTVYTGLNNYAAWSNGRRRPTEAHYSAGSYTSSRPVGTSNESSEDFYPPYCIVMYIIKVQ